MIFYHRGSFGDICYSLPTIISFGGGGLCLRKKNQYDFMVKLLEKQPCIDKVTYLDEFNFENVDINLDAFRKIHKKDLKKHLAQCHLDAFNKNYPLDNEWIYNIEPKHIGDIVIQVTPRYHTGLGLDWKSLHKYIDKCVFIGFPNDFKYFNKVSKYNIPSTQCKDSYEMARIIKGSKLFIGNQSVGFSIAEGIKHPRVLDKDAEKDNCRPNSDNGHIQLTEKILRKYL